MNGLASKGRRRCRGAGWVRAFGAAGLPLAAALLLPACGDRTGVPALDRQEVALGREVYLRHCASCHGEHGEGAPDWKVRNEQRELPPPPHDSEGHSWMHSDSLLYHMIARGVRDPFNLSEHLTMPAFEETLAPREIEAVVTYLKTLWTRDQRLYQWEQSRSQPFPRGSSAAGSGRAPDGSAP